MGRKKIQISRITDERNRQVTFNKRKFGVMKKAYELSVLCDCEIALIIFSGSNKLYQYASTDMDKVLLKYTEYNEPHESLTNKNIIEALSKKEHKNGACSPDSAENDTEFQLTPSTEAKYDKIDEAFKIMLQKNQMGRQQMETPNYPLPLNVSAGGYSNSSLLQTSPHMGQNNVSPRPSSSETESVYPSGSLLEMSNGYQNTSSPGRKSSPSPRPSPIPSNMQMKSNDSSKMSSSSTSSTRSNLRVVIPNQQDEVSSRNNSSHNTTLNTPVVALQTPALSSYANLFPDMNSSTDLSLGSMNWPSMQSHSNPLHLGVTNSSSVTSSPSPNSVHVKSEPNSPPRPDPLAHILHSSHAALASQHLAPGSSLSAAASLRHEYDGGPASKRPREWGP